MGAVAEVPKKGSLIKASFGKGGFLDRG